MPYLPYEEPSLQEILSLTSLLLLLNIARYLLDRLLYCGIVGEILIGVIWGLPVGGTAWLSEGVQKTIQAFGYLGLIGLVFEGGLGTEIVMLRKTAFTSVSIATVGLMLPIALSFILLLFPFSTTTGTAYPSPLAAFSAGASLCSTSLGTTFAILSSVNMQKTRTGVILVGAAMMDDVVGLVMVNIVTTLGSGNMAGWPIARPIAASFGLLLVTLLMCHFVLKPIWRGLVVYLDLEVELMSPPGTSSRFRIAAIKIIDSIPHLSFILPTLVLITYITIASFIDASVLFAAFIAGGVVNFLRDIQNQNRGPNTTNMNENTSSKMYDGYFRPAMDFILVPFFFVSNSIQSIICSWIFEVRFDMLLLWALYKIAY
ncbi:hypothetical protein G7Y89_g3085 [Cudoniella acicularis]|uniref:Cation/H+ exchanger transmembrane domain-containing protein n=1 Tax=Cudoniella acicularis TaxID=354080 RepID=A0A8H4RT88_9HELO|nr:hypothetical protein G7Y89_g3085 [Cudoniella acicularis]